MIKLAVIGANAPSESFYKQTKNLGYYIIGIAWAEGAVCAKYCDKFYPVSFTEKDEVLRICKEEHIDGITSFSLESALPTVVYVAQHMGLVSNSYECVQLTSTKYTQREAFRKNGILVPQYYRVKDYKELNVQDLKYPLIVKPIDSGGSQGITKLNDGENLANAIDVAISCSKIKEAIVEEFIDGREFSVEYLSCNGKHYNLQITDKVTSGAPHFIEIQHHQPADISQDMVCQIRTLVEKALDALKIENSPSHTEIKLNSKGELYIIEIGARMGGDYITSDLVRLSTGYDMVKGCIDLAVGRFNEPHILEKHYSGVYFYSELAPHIGEIIMKHEQYPSIVECAIVSNELHEAKSNADREGYFIYTSDRGKFKI